MDISKAFGVALKKLRQRQKITQVELAYRSGMDVSTISRFERGILSPSLHSTYVIAKALKVQPVEFIALIDEQEPDITIQE